MHTNSPSKITYLLLKCCILVNNGNFFFLNLNPKSKGYNKLNSFRFLSVRYLTIVKKEPKINMLSFFFQWNEDATREGWESPTTWQDTVLQHRKYGTDTWKQGQRIWGTERKSNRTDFSNCPSRALTTCLSSTCEHGGFISLLLFTMGLLCPPAVLQMHASRVLPSLWPKSSSQNNLLWGMGERTPTSLNSPQRHTGERKSYFVLQVKQLWLAPCSPSPAHGIFTFYCSTVLPCTIFC